MAQEVLEGLITDEDGIYVDATVGGGGHAAAILSGLSATGRWIGLDRDPAAIRMATETLLPDGNRVILKEGVFWRLRETLDALNVRWIDGILFDLGVSSRQIDDPARGFSYLRDGPLDMRMGEEGRSALEVVNRVSYEDLHRLFRDYGEERRAAAIARAICRARERSPILRTGELTEIIRSAIPQDQSQKTLARIFQAIRIEVNEELDHLRDALGQAVDHLRSGGRIGVISYHSLEDRTVKTAFSEWAQGCICPPDFPVCRCGKQKRIRFTGKWGRRGIRPTSQEIASNPRARSATLRISEKI